MRYVLKILWGETFLLYYKLLKLSKRFLVDVEQVWSNYIASLYDKKYEYLGSELPDSKLNSELPSIILRYF